MTDSAGAYSFHVDAPATYHLELRPIGCRSTGGPRDVPIVIRGSGGGLSGYGRADFATRAGGGGIPSVRFLDARAVVDSIAPCAVAENCTIPAGVGFRIRFTGASECGGRVAGFQWQRIWPGQTNPEPVQPYFDVSRFLPAGRDTFACHRYDSNSDTLVCLDTLWALRSDVLTVYSYPELYRSGRMLLLARVKDVNGLPSEFDSLRLQLNYDPDTRIRSIEACDCPAPPPGCATRGNTPVGWITGIDATQFDPQQWIPFCAGDTLPLRSKVRFHATGHDDPREASQREVGFSYRFTWRRLAMTNLNMPFSSEYGAADTPLPDGSSWHGGAIEWQTCPFDYTFFAAAVDENRRRDGTPDSIPFYIGGSPAIDSVYAPRVIVLVPTCPPFPPFDSLCTNPPSFGPDTLALVGTYVFDTQGRTPRFVGYNRFVLPFRAWGHDHPRDRNAPGREYYVEPEEGRIAAWKFDFDCVQPGCSNLEFPGEHTWKDDVETISGLTQQTFDDSLVVTIPFDTLCNSVPCHDESLLLVLATDKLGEYEFRIQGRDTFNGHVCFDLTDLGPNPNEARREIGPLGRTTQLVTRRVTWLELRDLRPAAKPLARAVPRRTAAARR